jgi:hypothetical protein
MATGGVMLPVKFVIFHATRAAVRSRRYVAFQKKK